ncbi:hypothetical protein [Streptomyces sp. CA-132043]
MITGEQQHVTPAEFHLDGPAGLLAGNEPYAVVPQGAAIGARRAAE